MSESMVHPGARPIDSAGHVRLIAGLPTANVKKAFQKIRSEVSTKSFSEFVEATRLEPAELTVILPPHIETSFLVENWDGSDYLATRFGEGARITNVVTVVDADQLIDQLASRDTIATLGWGKNQRDVRSVADILVGQIESATHLLLTGCPQAATPIEPVLHALNPTASRCTLEDCSCEDLRGFMTSKGEPAGEVRSDLNPRIVPPWLELLQGETTEASSSGPFLYRRALPFDRKRLVEWLNNPPQGLLRAKGTLWLAGENTRSFGYSCAGAVHRVFSGAPWWAGRHDGIWPTCETQRTRLLERWHLEFGDRRQEIVFVGLGLNPAEISQALDDCLLSEEAVLDTLADTKPGSGASEPSAPRTELH